MEKKQFMVKFSPRRPDFVRTMTAEEKMIVQQHHAYWVEQMKKGRAILFGPVFDPKGTHGICIVTVEDEEEVKGLVESDPASIIHNYEYYPMNATTSPQ
ncbi:MAG TPA: YciI family protein [Bacteroidota bacterium]|nr:YciI family protein [Bacteroidota bacterium]